MTYAEICSAFVLLPLDIILSMFCLKSLNFLQGLVATGLTKGQIFLGDISAQYKSGKTVVDVKVDTYSNVRTKYSALNILFIGFLIEICSHLVEHFRLIRCFVEICKFSSCCRFQQK